MKRYRKGDQFRPSTAAESAVHADALESFRRRPPSPQDQVPRPHDILVKTPAGGIAARSDATIYSAICTKCIAVGDATEKTIVETDEELIVYNLYVDAVEAEVYVVTSLTACGTRYVSSEPPVERWGKLDDAMTAGSVVTVSLWWDSATHSWGGWDEDSGEDWEVYAPPVMTSGTLDAGKWVKVKIMNGRKVAELHEC